MQIRLPKSVQDGYFGDLITLTRLPTQTFSKSEIVSLCDVLYLLSCQSLGGDGLGGGGGGGGGVRGGAFEPARTLHYVRDYSRDTSRC